MSAVTGSAEVRRRPARRPQHARDAAGAAAARPLVRLVAFAALGVYGALRWSVLLAPRPTWRLLGMLALAVLAAGVLGALHRRGRGSRVLAGLIAVAIVIVALLLSGVPFALIRHAHLQTIASGIGQGLAALPRVTIPYAGIDDWARIVVLLGAAVLLLDAGLLLAFAPAALGDARRAGAALPLIALAVVPSTLIRPSLPYLHGLVLLVLLAALVWGERLRGGALTNALVITAAAGGVALTVAPALDTHEPWVNYQSFAGAFSPAHVESFDWVPRYGPLNWPRTGREMLDVKAQRADYWKAQNLDRFDGFAWGPGTADAGALLPPPAASAQARFTQTLRVTLRGMQTTQVIAAGAADAPQHLPTSPLLGDSPGTWTTGVNLGPGDSYDVTTYSPRPPSVELAAAARLSYPDGLTAGYRSLSLPTSVGPPPLRDIVFAPFHSSGAGTGAIQLGSISAALAQTPYGEVYALAQQLAGASATPFEFVQRVQRYLAHGFTYSENPPRRPFPLASFLLLDKRGYCQQFSGAMALLLRMGGVPARVAAGFATGSYDGISHQYIVTDLDAHSWVEVWFPRYGWVRFDPTPAVAPALSGRTVIPALGASGANGRQPAQRPRRRAEPPLPAPAAGGRPAAASSHSLAVVLGAALALLLAALAGAAVVRGGSRGSEQLIAELERALARSGRPLQRGTTLSQLEHRFRSSPAAAAYVRALRLSRYRSGGEAPPAAGRRALRARLADGLGPSGKLRAWWALPPRPSRGPRRAAEPGAGGRRRRR